MSDFGGKNVKIIDFGWAPPQTPFVELIALP